MDNERIIKRYTNRKLYDKLASRYVTLQEIARLVRNGEEVKVIDNDSGEDLTAVTLAQIILEEEKRKTHLISVPFLRKLIQLGEARVQDLSDRATRGIEALGGFTEKASERVREVARESGRALEEGLSVIDDIFATPQRRLEDIKNAARGSVSKFRSSSTVQKELERVESSLRVLEKAVARLRDDEGEDDTIDRDEGESGAGNGHRERDPDAAGGERESGGQEPGDEETAGPSNHRAKADL